MRGPFLVRLHSPGLCERVEALGRIAQYRNSGQPLPEGAAATADGVPTTDPELARMPLPLGGAKGAGGRCCSSC
ncbi:LDH2 family malate/lactate/ureidoglycolate dehydrogenase [Nonomuraea thailandensis]|uniref:LDH2 family malate/lactate/ureidoglycolate dehydrogenase n=1 Tax=Nonomuraea thailandensis TaxID=1188745 RepID=A0A9X2K2Z2_9ACTN|nr:Ldh family oxidoreductase [Nonomuraea thailandensis]MCP2357565.1 LDH2 family malate/lactate/ureidoglycolate dehydrogenase [Nonomuraea thailandensis]